ncbi:hypothetical protein GE09DRAFT_1118435 [Coniochaeta sp. 2T2.1]|nr:hypothetical protein GE09DRAFT_1118435 [Coniochaeta sp. 2T2.1]
MRALPWSRMRNMTVAVAWGLWFDTKPSQKGWWYDRGWMGIRLTSSVVREHSAFNITAVPGLSLALSNPYLISKCLARRFDS